MSFNDKLSYTEHSVVSPTSDFTIGFEDYALTTKDRINVTVDDIDAKDAGYTVTRKSNLVVTLTPPVPNGVVRLQRETNIDTPFHRFTAGAKFVASNVDQNFTQILHSQQEIRNLFGFTQEYIQRTLDNFDLRIQGVEGVILDLRQDYSNLDKRITKEVGDRKQGDQDLKDYIDSTVNGITGESFLPIQDRFVTTESGRTQRDKNNEVKSILDFGGVVGETCPRLSEKFTTLDDAKSAYPAIADKITTLDLYVNDVAVWLANSGGCKTLMLPTGTFRFLNNYNLPVDLGFHSHGTSYIKYDNYYWIRRWDGGTQKQTLHFYFDQENVTTLVDGVAEPITWIAPNTFTVTSTAPKGNLQWRIDVKGAQIAIGNTLTYPVLSTYLSFAPKNRKFSYDLSGNYGRTSGKGANNTGYGHATLASLTTGGNNTVVGYAAGSSITDVENQVFIGFQCGHRHVKGEGNTGVGTIALEHLTEGVYNVAVGCNAQGSKVKGSNNVSVGAETLWSWGDCSNNTAVGHRAMANGNGTGENNVAVGTFSQDFGAGSSNTSMGYRALAGTTGASGFLTGNDNVIFGAFSGRYLGGASARNTTLGMGALGTANLVSEVTAVGYLTLNKLTTGIKNTAVGYESLKAMTTGEANTAIGYGTLVSNVMGSGNTALGVQVMEKATASENTGLGTRTLMALLDGISNTAVGYEAGRFLETGSANAFVGLRAGRSVLASNNTALGADALQFQTTGEYNTALGRLSLRLMQDGTNATLITNSTGVGANTAVSGSDQVQLGNSATTTYVYGTVQNRSDARDKADIRDTELGLPFINSLRPVDYKWDMREDYIETLEDGTVIKHERDGSKKRERFHHGFIAQEVPEGFGGYQDHKINGGSDVLSLGYDEFIAPMVKAIQELSKEVESLKKQLESK